MDNFGMLRPQGDIGYTGKPGKMGTIGPEVSFPFFFTLLSVLL